MPISIGNNVVAFHNNLGQRLAISIGDTVIDPGTAAPSPDTPGTLTIAATRRSRGAGFVVTLVDRDGIRSITSADMTGQRGRSVTFDALSQFSRTDANTFGATFTRNNNRFREGFLEITYVDNTSGQSHVIRQTWNV